MKIKIFLFFLPRYGALEMYWKVDFRGASGNLEKSFKIHIEAGSRNILKIPSKNFLKNLPKNPHLLPGSLREISSLYLFQIFGVSYLTP